VPRRGDLLGSAMSAIMLYILQLAPANIRQVSVSGARVAASALTQTKTLVMQGLERSTQPPLHPALGILPQSGTC
jgi:hypothetical protein